MNVPIVHYDSEHVRNPNPKGDTPFEEFWEVRGALLSATQNFGETGPGPSESPWYYLIDDQYNDEHYQYMEVYEPAAWNTGWLLALVEALHEHRGWGVGISVYEGYVLVFADRVMVNGATFADCRDLESVAQAAREATERFIERKYGPLKKQLKYIEMLLPSAMKTADANTFAHVATFDGYELFEGHAVWILQTKGENKLRASAKCGRIRSSPVTADRIIHPECCKDFSPYNNVEPPYWLLTYLIENKSQKAFRLFDENDKSVATLRIGPIVCQEEVDRSCETKSL